MEALTPLPMTSARSALCAHAGNAQAFMTCDIQPCATLSKALLWSPRTTALALLLGRRAALRALVCLLFALFFPRRRWVQLGRAEAGVDGEGMLDAELLFVVGLSMRVDCA
eukprot:15570325-Heterocapsa_arctica.AAC.2